MNQFAGELAMSLQLLLIVILSFNCKGTLSQLLESEAADEIKTTTTSSILLSSLLSTATTTPAGDWLSTTDLLELAQAVTTATTTTIEILSQISPTQGEGYATVTDQVTQSSKTTITTVVPPNPANDETHGQEIPQETQSTWSKVATVVQDVDALTTAETTDHDTLVLSTVGRNVNVSDNENITNSKTEDDGDNRTAFAITTLDIMHVLETSVSASDNRTDATWSKSPAEEAVDADKVTTMPPFLDNATRFNVNDALITTLFYPITLTDNYANETANETEATIGFINNVADDSNITTEISEVTNKETISGTPQNDISRIQSTQSPPPLSFSSPMYGHQSDGGGMTLADKITLGVGLFIGISFVAVVGVLTTKQCLGYWARRDYSNLDQDNISFGL